jgi:hydroxyquinol 1,2-dioxygenase
MQEKRSVAMSIMQGTPASTSYFTETGSAEAVNARMGEATDPRLRRIMEAMVRHLHAFIKEVEPTEEEWAVAIDFLTRTGQISSDVRQEYILLSDVLGVSMLVDAINHRRAGGATENTVLGPFHVDGAPERQMGESINLDGQGETCLYEGRVLDLQGRPIANAYVDAWSDNAEGFYDVQQPGLQPPMNNRGLFRTGGDGVYRFIGIKPVSYPIPDDGPVGQLLGRLGRHPYRPAHMHFLVGAEGYKRVTTHTFVAGDPYLTSDAVFGVKDSLIVDFEKVEGENAAWRARFDFVLEPA